MGVSRGNDGDRNVIGILASGREIMVNDCRCAGSSHYRHTEKPGKSLISADYRPITPRLPPQFSRTNPKRDRMAGHSQFKNIMHRKGRQDAQKSKLFSKLAREITVAAKMGAPDPSDERAAARRDHLRPPGEHVEGLDRARGEEGDRQRGRELRRDPLRGLRSRRRRCDRRGADRQPQPRGLRHPLLLHQVRRQSRRNRLGRLHVRPHRHHRIRRQGRLRRRHAGSGDRGRRRRRRSPARTATRSTPRRKPFARSQKRWRRNSAKPARRR